MQLFMVGVVTPVIALMCGGGGRHAGLRLAVLSRRVWIGLGPENFEGKQLKQ